MINNLKLNHQKSTSLFSSHRFQRDLRRIILPILKVVRLGDEDIFPHPNFEALLNIFLVWTRARDATIPLWTHVDENIILSFIKQLNSLSQGELVDVVIIELSRICSNDNITSVRIITRCDNQNILRLQKSLATDIDIGHALGYY